MYINRINETVILALILLLENMTVFYTGNKISILVFFRKQSIPDESVLIDPVL